MNMPSSSSSSSSSSANNRTPLPIKRVRFNDVVSELCQVPRVENKEDVWYNKTEFSTFTKDLRLTIRALRKNAALISRLEEAFQFSLSLAGHLVDEHDEETALTRIRSHDNLQCWSGNDQRSFLGLEYLSSPFIKCHSDLCKEVNGRLGAFIKAGKSDEDDIQRLCSTNSRCARIFARLMAECNANASFRSSTPDLYTDDNNNNNNDEPCSASKKLKTNAGGRKVLGVGGISKNHHPLNTTTSASMHNNRKRRAAWSSLA